MKGNKFLAAVLAASMAFSMVPATTLNVFADSVSVEASDTAVTSTDQVVVVNTVDGKSTISKKLQAAVVGLNGTAYYDSTNKTANSTATSEIATAIKTKDSTLTMTISDVKFTDVDHWSFVAYDASGTYTVTIDAAPTLETVNSALKTALDNYFDSKEFTKAKDKTLRNTDIADVIDKDASGNVDITAAMDEDTDFTGISYDSDYSFEKATISGDGTAIGSDGSGKLTISILEKNGSNNEKTVATFTYNFTANVTESDDTASEANKKALATVNANTYPDYRNGSTVTNSKNQSVNHEESLLRSKIFADLKDAGYTGATSLGTDAAVEEAAADSNGEYKVIVNPNNDVVDVELTYSSDQKLNDTKNSLKKFLAKGGKVTNAVAKVTEHKDTAGNFVSLDDVTSVAATDSYSYTTSSSLSQKVQAKSAVTATTAADAAEIVKEDIDARLKKDGVDNNGVKVSVTPVNTATPGTGDNSSKYKVEAASKEATPSTNDSKITLLVTASINNDFYGWKDASGNTDDVKTVKQNYLMTIDTNPLKENKVKTISLADKTILLTGGYYDDSKSNGQNSGNEVTYVEITPVIDPADTNSTVKYTVLDSDKTVITDDVKVGTDDVYKKDSNTAVKVGTNALGLKITKEGTYTIKATVDDAEATMTLTVKKNFDDVPVTAYYYDAVKWAYGSGMTAGISANKFGVNNSVTRAQYVTWLYNYAVSKDSSVAIADADVKATFSDVSTSAYYAKAVQWATNAGVTGGTGKTTFSPNKTITRAEAIVMLWAADGRPYAGTGSEYQSVLHFTDVPTSAYYATAVTWAVQSGVTTGTSTTTFSPDNTCTRSQAITFIHAAFVPTTT